MNLAGTTRMTDPEQVFRIVHEAAMTSGHVAQEGLSGLQALLAGGNDVCLGWQVIHGAEARLATLTYEPRRDTYCLRLSDVFVAPEHDAYRLAIWGTEAAEVYVKQYYGLDDGLASSWVTDHPYDNWTGVEDNEALVELLVYHVLKVLAGTYSECDDIGRVLELSR